MRSPTWKPEIVPDIPQPTVDPTWRDPVDPIAPRTVVDIHKRFEPIQYQYHAIKNASKLDTDTAQTPP